MVHRRLVYPFSALVGQEDLKSALLLNAVNPMIGGLLIRGQKGTGKSSAVRALADILPSISAVKDCPFNCNPWDPTNMCATCLEKFNAGEELEAESRDMRIVSLPIGATEDRVIGSLDIEKAITQGVRALQPGLLAEANQGILYIDEVNLLSDHITDSILDAAASGWNVVERVGVSVSHPSRFILVGTMNPEEGELRPQILDRFGVFAETANIQDPEVRALILRRDEQYRRDPYTFMERYEEGLRELRRRIMDARARAPSVEVSKELMSSVAEACSKLRVDGLRPDIVAVKAAKALAAFEGRGEAARNDIFNALSITLGHRTRRSGLVPPPEEREIRRALRVAELRQRFDAVLKVPNLGSVLLLPYEVFERLVRRARLWMALWALSLVFLFASMVYFLDWARHVFTDVPFQPSVLLLEVVIVVLLVAAMTLFQGKRRREEDVAVVPFKQDIHVSVSGRLADSHLSTTGATGGGLQGRVSYLGEDTSGLGFGPKILGSLQSLHRRPGAVKREKRVRGKGGSSLGGRRTNVVSGSTRGRYAWYRAPRGSPRDIALVPTIWVAALKQVGRSRGPRVVIEAEDIREKVREYSAPRSVVLLVDMSLSMIESVDNIVDTIYDLHGDVYRRRDRVGLVVFKGSRAYTLQHPTRNLDLVVRKLRDVGASDFTPLAAGLFQAWRTLRQERLRNSDADLHLIVVSDGIANVPLDRPLSPLTRRRYSNEAQADAFDVARLLARDNIHIRVVNTRHSPGDPRPRVEEGKRIMLTPTQFLQALARVSKGDYLGQAQTTRHVS